MKNIIVIPYFNEDEVKRFLKTAYFLRDYAKNKCDYEFLLLNDKIIKPNKKLFEVFSSIAQTQCLEAKKVNNSYPEGPGEFFWEAMDYISENHEKDGGFVLWFESDMLPKVADWVDRLEAEWEKYPEIVIMGLYVPNKYNVLSGGFIPEHINGAGCYSKDFSRFFPVEERGAPFDVANFQSLKKSGKKYHKTRLFKFSHMYSICEDIENDEVVFFHGYRQNRDEFIEKAIMMIRDPASRDKEKQRLSKIPTKGKVCCKRAVKFLNSIYCDIHTKHSLFTFFMNRLLYYKIRAQKKLKRFLT